MVYDMKEKYRDIVAVNHQIEENDERKIMSN